MTTIKPGTLVRDKDGKENYGLRMNVIDEAYNAIKVSYLNLEGFCQEAWLQKDRVVMLNGEDDAIHPLNAALY